MVKNVVTSGRVGVAGVVSDGVVKARGLRDVAYGEMVFFPESGARGFTCNLNKNNVDIMILNGEINVKSGSLILAAGSSLRIPVSKKFLGRVINPLGELIDGGDDINDVKYMADIHLKAPGIIFRERISEPMFTGLKVIDSLIPVGRGQRELIIGDKGTGKTSVCFDAILNQKNENYYNSIDKIYCVYVSIGQKKSSVKSIYDNLNKLGAMDYTTIVAATAADSASFQYLAPYSGCALAEFFMSSAHSLVIYDDLSQHAVAYRQMSLLLRRPPGREAYPGDVFYLHSRLLERAAKLHSDFGGGSLTALPVVETLFGDVTAYIPTNVISITDGQIFLDRGLFTEGTLPAVNIGLSVSRVGSAAQILSMKKVAGSLKLELAQFREIKDFIKFGSDLSDDTIANISRGELLTEILKQERFSPVPIEIQVLSLFAGINGYLKKIKKMDVNKVINSLVKFARSSVLFAPHLELLRFDEYYREFGNSALEMLVFYYINYESQKNFIAVGTNYNLNNAKKSVKDESVN